MGDVNKGAMMMSPIPAAKTCAEAWLRAATHLSDSGDEAYNLLLDIDDPLTHTKEDRVVIKTVDDFLRSKRAAPISTVVNTIFPQKLYLQHGSNAFVPEYLRAYDSLRRKDWGRYFERMVRWPTANGKTEDQLHTLIRRLTEQNAAPRTFRNIYEMTLFDPARDLNLIRNRQCLSFLSFKLHKERGLTLTAVYRNHDYIGRALGNFIGLGHLMDYMAKQIGTTVGPLTCVSTHAFLESAAAKDDPEDGEDAFTGWRLSEVRQLIHSARTISGYTGGAAAVTH